MNGLRKCGVYTTIYHKEDEIMFFAGKWMELEIIMLHKVGQAQKDKSHMFSLICGS
jgi:hypothetical protein